MKTDAPTGEIRQTSTTGGQKGSKPARYDLLPLDALHHVAAAHKRAALTGFTPETGSTSALIDLIFAKVNEFWNAKASGAPVTEVDRANLLEQDRENLADACTAVFALLTDERLPDDVLDVWNTPDFTTDSATTGYALMPPAALEAVAVHYGIGAQKYADNNWRLGYSWSLMYSALHRHLAAHRSGELIDHETGSPHLAAVAFHLLGLMTFVMDQPGYDDRYQPPSGF